MLLLVLACGIAQLAEAGGVNPCVTLQGGLQCVCNGTAYSIATMAPPDSQFALLQWLRQALL